MLKENYEKVKENIVRACEKAGRSPEDVTLIAVSKTKPLSDIEELLSDTDAVDFGENKVLPFKEARDGKSITFKTS